MLNKIIYNFNKFFSKKKKKNKNKNKNDSSDIYPLY